jgi:methyl-accepting chemotaxis protein
MLPRVESGFAASNQAIVSELNSLRTGLVEQVDRNFAAGYEAKATGLVKSIVPLIQNYFLDSVTSTLQEAIDTDDGIVAVRYRLRATEEFQTLGEASGDVMEFKAAKDPANTKVELSVLVSKATLVQAEKTERAIVDKIEEQLSASSTSLEKRILEDARNIQDEIGATLTRDIWITTSLIGIVIIGVSIWLLRRVVIVPLQIARKNLLALSNGELTLDMHANSNNEIGEMVSAMQVMVSNLRRIAGDIQQSVNTVLQNAENLSSITHNLVQGAREQSGKASEAAAAVTEMSQSFLDVARNAAEASNSAKASNALAQSGRSTVSVAATGMLAISDKTTESSELITQLGRSGEEITRIVNVINEIAEQTNLLALNAAIEAARAGEQGRGFAVVADEVRQLAARTGSATKEISQMIEKIQSGTVRSVTSMSQVANQVGQGVSQAEEARHAMEGIVSASENSLLLIERIAAAVEQQSAAAEQVSASVENIAGVSRTTEDMSASLQAAAMELSNLSSRLGNTIAWFKVDAA